MCPLAASLAGATCTILFYALMEYSLKVPEHISVSHHGAIVAIRSILVALAGSLLALLLRPGGLPELVIRICNLLEGLLVQPSVEDFLPVLLNQLGAGGGLKHLNLVVVDLGGRATSLFVALLLGCLSLDWD